MMLSSRFILRRNVFVALALSLSVYLLHYFQIVSFNELAAVDLRMLLRPNTTAHEEIVLVGIDDKSLEAQGGWPWNWKTHSLFIESLQEFEPRLIYYDVLFTDSMSNDKSIDFMSKKIEKAANVILPFYYYSESPLKAFFPPRSILESAKGIGFSNLNPDADGRIRKIKISIEGEQRRYFHTVIEMLFRSFRDQEEVTGFLREIPVNEKNEAWVNFSGPENSFTEISFYDVQDLLKKNDLDRLRSIFHNKTVLVGPTYSGNVYLRPTLFSAQYPSIVLFGNALNMLLSKSFLRDASPIWGLLIVVFLSLFLAIQAEKWDVRALLLSGLLLMFSYTVLNLLIFHFLGVIVPLFMPLVALLLTFLYLLFSGTTELRFENEIFGREMEMASEVQSTFLPSHRPQIEGFDVAFECRFAKSVGGDLYDWLDLGENRIGVAVGDVSGKGVPAAIYMVRAISEFRRENQSHRTPSEVFEALNKLLAVQSYAGMFLTAVYGIVDLENQRVSISSAGHEPVIYYSAKKRTAELISPKKGPPVGLFTDSQYETIVLNYAKGDMFLFLSDGVTEFRNFKKEQLGIEFIRKFVQEHARDLSSRGMIEALFNEMEHFGQSTKAHDDRTLLCFKLGKYF
jgi:serine phosphatase RsbU (regulator of sigma subunit)/CHASE2 domain-containing sensor protein